MTYCVGVLLESGVVLASDSRTNAGVDHIMTARKMTVFEKPSERVIVLLASGNLAICQAVVNLLQENISGEDDSRDLMAARSMYRTARIVGSAIREIHTIDGEDLASRNIEFNVSFILGGQIKGDQTRLFHVYAEGNFIEASPETPYIQIGETKYGKPVLDRIIHPRLSLEEAAKCVLVSYTSTMRSNVSVGLPIDLLVYKKDTLRVSSRTVIEEGDPYFKNLNDVWAGALQRAFENIPNPDLSLRDNDDRVARIPGPSAA